MASLLRVPEVATGDTEATLTNWIVQIGASFAEDDALATVETAKAAVDIAAEAAGVLLATLVDDGAEVQVGEPIALVGEPGEVVDDVAAALAQLGVADGGAAGADEGGEPAAAAETSSVTEPVEPATATSEPRRIFASPLARRLAREAGLGLEEIAGTGPRGRIRRRDVDAAVAALAATPAPTAVPRSPGARPQSEASYVDIPHTRIRKAIARRLTQSVQEAPQFTVSGRPRVDRLLGLRAELREAGVRVSVNDLLVKAIAIAHKAIPEMNVIWTDEAVRRFGAVDVAVAVATETGLVTPVLRGVDALGVAEVAAASADLVERARAGSLRQDELEGGTISVSNLGMFGTREFTAIVNPPHAAILAVGAVTEEPVAADGTVGIEKVMRLTLSVDHRPVDGAVAARWMSALVEALEQPLRLFV